MPGLHKLCLILLTLACVSRPVAAAKLISDAQARRLSPAIAKITLQRETTRRLLDYCASHFSPLRTQSTHVRRQWLQRNHQILHKAASLHERLWQSLKQRRSGLQAETFNLDIDQLVQHYVVRQIHAMQAYTPTQQFALCKHLITAVHAGAWDIARKQAGAYAILEKFH